MAEIPLAAVSGGLRLGGSSTFLVNLGCAFADMGLQLPIVNLSEPNDHAGDFAVCSVPVKTISLRRDIYEDRLRFAYEELQQWKPRAVVACLGSESFELLRYVPPGVARIGMIQSHDPAPYDLVRRFAPWLDSMVGVSQTICREIKEMPEFKGLRVEYIPYGIRFPRPARSISIDPAQPLKLIYVGRIIEPQKRISRLAELARELSRRNVNFSFTIAGTGPGLGAFRREVEAIPAVKFVGEVRNRDVLELLQKHEVFVLLSDYEGLPLSLLEAMGAGLVSVVSDLESGIRDVVIDGTGYRVAVGDTAAAADAITDLSRDRVRLAEIASAAAAHARTQYSAERMAMRFLGLANELSSPARTWPPLRVQPAPVGMQPQWLYTGLPRVARRYIRRLLPARPKPSSRS